MAAVDRDTGTHEALARAQAEGRDAGEDGLLIPAGYVRNAFLLGGLWQQDVMLERGAETGVAPLRATVNWRVSFRRLGRGSVCSSEPSPG